MRQRSDTFSNIVRKQLGREHPHAHLRADEVKGPLSFFNPTAATFDLVPASKLSTGPASGIAPHGPLPTGARLAWRARDNRKGRHVLVIPSNDGATDAPAFSTSWSHIRRILWRMCTVYAWWDVSWWIAVLFSWGSALFLICGFFYWLPLAAPSTEFPNESSIGGGLTAFIGATMFTVGGVLLVVEASNEHQTGCFGWAVENLFTHSDSDTEPGSRPPPDGKLTIRQEACTHHHATGAHSSAALHLQHPEAGRRWEWCPTWQEFRRHYIYEIGFMASFVLAIGAVIFYVSGIMALPWIYDKISQPVLYGTYWLAYLGGGILFVVSSALYMLETQPKWYLPAPRVLGWWIGTFNMIGSVGWTLSAAFGYCTASWCEYQSDLSLLWASLAFLMGSLLLWYEAMDKYPVIRASG